MQYRNPIFVLLAAIFTAVPAMSTNAEEKPAVNRVVEGAFEVQVLPQQRDATQADVAIDRLLLEKRYRGGLDATARGQMLGVTGAVETSGAYVAIERVEGALDGKRGAFSLYHSGTMSKATGYTMNVKIVPDSGTGELTGIEGKLTILIAPGGGHSYKLAYTLPDR